MYDLLLWLLILLLMVGLIIGAKYLVYVYDSEEMFDRED
ncbi:hypothetical protein JOC55_003098 [Paenibacillus sacheonensis]|nr:hypothetical protein [Paenibacillus sacheonensis]